MAKNGKLVKWSTWSYRYSSKIVYSENIQCCRRIFLLSYQVNIKTVSTPNMIWYANPKTNYHLVSIEFWPLARHRAVTESGSLTINFPAKLSSRCSHHFSIIDRQTGFGDYITCQRSCRHLVVNWTSNPENYLSVIYLGYIDIRY